MSTIAIGRKIIIDTYANADKKGKALLESMFSKDDLIGDLMDRVLSIEDIFKELGKDAAMYAIPVNGTYREKADMYMRQLELGPLLFNGGVKINVADISQNKYEPYFKVIPDEAALGGFRLSCDDYDYDNDAANLGARPQYLNSAHATHLGKVLLAQYEGFAQNRQMAINNGEYDI